VQREAVHLGTQRALGLRLPATIAAEVPIAPARARTEGRASSHRRGGEAGQQVVGRGAVGVGRGVLVDPFPGLAQRTQHVNADALHEQLHVGVRHFRLRVEHRLTLPRHPAVGAVQPEHMPRCPRLGTLSRRAESNRCTNATAPVRGRGTPARAAARS